MNIQEITKSVEREGLLVHRILSEMEKVVVGQRTLMERLLIGLLCDGHLLLEGLPGLGKTTAVKTLASVIKASFQRIQFTPDLLPAGIIGSRIYRPDKGFEFKKGPIFHNIILADQINRAPASVQSALLEAMQERQVTIGRETFLLERLFLVLATQNPIKEEGTYPLPWAQIDRFMLKIKVDYPTLQEEKEIVERVNGSGRTDFLNVVEFSKLDSAKALVREIRVEEKIMDYVLRLIRATRDPGKFGIEIGPYVSHGASPRGSIWLALAARAHAFLKGRGYVTPWDVKTMAPDVLRHRIILSDEADEKGKSVDKVIEILLEQMEVP
ncbi:MAG: AAA family ATPase [Desulfobacteraceae bacterium]|nr:MAG: AAA family ATPase [Desulfobacteraceae bacterium]